MPEFLAKQHGPSAGKHVIIYDVSMHVTAGFKEFFSPPPLTSATFSVRGIGVHERMPPSLIRRQRGTGDFLFMLFHDEALAACSPESPVTHAPNTLFIWPPDTGQFYGHEIRSYSHTWIHCSGTKVRAWLRAAGLATGAPLAIKEPRIFSDCLLALHEELTAHGEPDATIAAHLFEIGLRRVARSLRLRAASTSVPEGVLAARRLIGVASATPVTLPLLARTAGMSVSTFCMRFKEAFGRTPVQCLIEHRLDHAAHLLDDSTLGVAEIAQRVGYTDAFHFSKAFKKRFGKSPRALREDRCA